VQTLPVYPVDPVTPHRSGAPSCLEGFHGLETEDGLAFQWMAGRGRVAVPGVGGRFLELWVRSHFADLSQRLELGLGAETRAETLVPGWNALSVALPAGCAAVGLRVDRLFPAELHPGDGRELAIQVRPPRVHADTVRHARMRDQHRGAVAHARRGLGDTAARLPAARELRFGSGFHGSERDEGLPFRWMASRGQLLFSPADEERYLELRVRGEYHDLSQKLSLLVGPELILEQPLVRGWNALSFAVPPRTDALELRVSRCLPVHLHPDDPRDLGNIESYETFLKELTSIFAECGRVLRPKQYLAAIVGDFRDGGRYRMFHADLAAELEEQTPFVVKGLTILYQTHKRVFPYGYPAAFVPNLHHQYIVILRNEK